RKRAPPSSWSAKADHPRVCQPEGPDYSAVSSATVPPEPSKLVDGRPSPTMTVALQPSLLQRAGLHHVVEGGLVVVIGGPLAEVLVGRETVARLRRHVAGEDRGHAGAIGPCRLVDAARGQRRAQAQLVDGLKQRRIVRRDLVLRPRGQSQQHERREQNR